MKIYYIRHGEPTYDEHDSLTKNGQYQVEEISKYLSKIPFKKAYVSPVLRAKRSAEPTLKKLGISATEIPWGSEDFAWLKTNVYFQDKYVWPFDHPHYQDIYNKYKDKNIREFFRDPEIKNTKQPLVIKFVDKGIDKWCKTLGIKHDRKHKKYIFKKPTEKEVIIFAHQGISTFILSSLLDETYPHFVSTHKPIDCASISIIDINEETGKASLEVYNDIKY